MSLCIESSTCTVSNLVLGSGEQTFKKFEPRPTGNEVL